MVSRVWKSAAHACVSRVAHQECLPCISEVCMRGMGSDSTCPMTCAIPHMLHYTSHAALHLTCCTTPDSLHLYRA